MRLILVFLLTSIVVVASRRENSNDAVENIFQQKNAKKSSTKKKVLDQNENEEEEQEKRPENRWSKNQTESNSNNELDEASICVNEFDLKSGFLVKVKELKNGARLSRVVQIDEPSPKHGLTVRDICMLNCCVEKNCDLAMLSEQRGTTGYKCYLFSCNGSCSYAPHDDYTSMILKKDFNTDLESSSPKKVKDKATDATSSTLATTCRSTEFSCRDGTCIPYYDVCNSYEDCPSGVDESMCSPEFSLHQRTQQENRKKLPKDEENLLEEVLDDLADDEQQAGPSSTTTVRPKTTTIKRKSNSSSFLYNIDLETQDRVSRLQKLKEHLEETKGPEAWYHLFQTLIQHQQQDHSSLDPDLGGSSSSNDDENFKDHLLALEQQWIADRQKSFSTTTTKATTTTKRTTRPTESSSKKSKINSRKSTTTRPMKLIDEDFLEDEEENEAAAFDDDDRYFWQPSYDERRTNRLNSQPKPKTSTRTNKIKSTTIDRENLLLTVEPIEVDKNPHAKSFLRESTIVFLLLVGLILTIGLLVLVGFHCRDSWKRGRIFKNRSTDADYLINGLYL